MNISIITVTYNAEEFIQECLESVFSQNYSDFEYIIVDGNSTDRTLEIVNKYRSRITKIICEPDGGIYDAMNKGIASATGNIIGILNSDDFFPSNDVLTTIAKNFEEKDAQIVYGNLRYVNPKTPHKIIREWISRFYKDNLFQWGWMPAHPTFYARRELFERYGNYNIAFKSASDYELMLRFMYKFKLKSVYINKLLVVMRTGGVSNKSLKNRMLANWNDFRAMRHNGLPWPLLAIVLKPLRKISQYF